VAAADEGGVEGDDVHAVAQAEALLEEPARDAKTGEGEARVDEDLARVVAGLSVDVDGAGEVGGARVVEPVRVGEPGVGLGEEDEVSRVGMVEPDLGALAALKDS